MLRLAEDRFGDGSPVLIPLLYNDAIEKYRTAAFLRSKDELGFDAREIIGEAELRSPRGYLREGKTGRTRWGK